MKQERKNIINYYNIIKTIINNKYLFMQLTKRNILERFKGSFLGVVWLFIFPIFMLAIYTFIFTIIFKARWGSDAGNGDSKIMFAMMLFCGMSAFNIFSESVGTGVASIVNKTNYVKKVVFPLELIPLSIACSSFIIGLVWFIILIISLLCIGHAITFKILLLPIFLIPVFLLSSGVSWFVASLCVYIRDLVHAVPIILQVLFFTTPIFYSLRMVPEPFKSILKINPLAIIIQGIRAVVIKGEMPSINSYIYVLLLSIVCSVLGYAWFMKTKKGFADVL